MKPIPTPKNVVTHLRAMHDRLNDGWAHVDDAWWTTEAAAIIERLVFQRDEADAAQATLKAERDEACSEIELLRRYVTDCRIEIVRICSERDEARKECCSTWEAVMFRPATDIAADKGWDCFKALEETAREMHKGGD